MTLAYSAKVGINDVISQLVNLFILMLLQSLNLIQSCNGIIYSLTHGITKNNSYSDLGTLL